MEEIRELVFKEVGIIIKYRVPIDFRMQLKPRLNFISTNVATNMCVTSCVGVTRWLTFGVMARGAKSN
jgi:hypothetical protein